MWIIPNNNVTVIHEFFRHEIVVERFSTISREIALQLAKPVLVKIFDI